MQDTDRTPNTTPLDPEQWPEEMRRGIELLCDSFERACRRKEYRKPELVVIRAETEK